MAKAKKSKSKTMSAKAMKKVKGRGVLDASSVAQGARIRTTSVA